MNSRLGGSEEALAADGLAPLAGRPAPRVLIGGLGMGFTLRAALELLPPGARVTVSELVPEIANWARGPMAQVMAGALDDPRVELRIGDVAAEMARPAARDAILLDVDNGPDGLTREGNGALYAEAGLRAARRALAPGGALAVWSAAPDRAFSARLARCGFAVTERTVRAARSGRGARHMIWTGVRGA